MNKAIVILPDLSQSGGISGYNRDLVRGLESIGYKLVIISRNDYSRQTADFCMVGFAGYKNIFIRKLAFSVTFLFKALSFKPELVICAHANFSALCYLAFLLFGTKYIVFMHGIEVWGIKSRLKIKSLLSAVSLVSVSNFTADKVREYIPEIGPRISILPNAIDKNKFYPKERPRYLLERHSLKEGDKIILTIARLSMSESEKGYHKIIEIMPILLKEVPGLKYILAGSGDDYDNIKSLVEKKGLSADVILPGHISDTEIADYYNLCDLFVLPSKKEGFGRVFLEAAACGKPVIAGSKDGSAEALLNGQLGTLVDPDDKQGIARAIIEALNKKDDAAQGSERREMLIRAFGWDSFYAKLKDILL